MPKGNLEHDNTSNAPNTSQLKAFISRIEAQGERVQAEKDDLKEIYAELKAFGLSPKIVRILVRRRAMEKAKRDEEDTLLDLYSKATGTPSPADAEADE
jgi:uncharacterized protein (UPF0335 family)